MQAALMIRSKKRVARRKRLKREGRLIDLPSNVCVKKLEPFPRFPPDHWVGDLDTSVKIDKMLEVCVDNLSSVNVAVEGGAQRIELCSALSEGGLTPTVGFLKLVKRTHPNLTVFAMLRPRCGNFVYSQLEMDCILEDMKELHASGVDGFVFGALTVDRQIDEDHCTLVKQHSNSLPLTFHRAIDITDSTMLTENVAKVERLGFNRILTSGLQRTAEQGMENIAKMQQFSKNIIVVPGAGINLKNVETILSTTGFHSSASIKTIDGAPEEDIDFGKIMRTDADIVRNLVKIGQQFL